MNKILILFLFSMMVSPAVAFIIYDTSIQSDTALTNVTLGLDSASSVNYWDVSYILPENTQIISIRDTIGPITQYSQVGKSVSIKTNSGSSRTKEIITISIKTQSVVDNTYDPLKVLKLSYSGFEKESTVVNVKTNDKIITSNIPFGFSIDKKDNILSVSGQGPVNLIIAVSNSGKDTNNYVVIGNGNVDDAQKLNQVVPRIIGIIPYYNKFPIVVLPDSSYTSELDGFSAGTYKTGGLILVPQSKLGTKESAGIILHETTHAYNDQIFRWSNAKTGWFDEGMATYVGWTVNQLTGTTQPEIFGSDTSYYEGLYKYTVSSEGNREDLWNYYQQNKNYMRYWNSHADQSDSARKFGYAFSQLMIRYYVYQNGPESIHNLYQKLNKVDHIIESDDEYTNMVLSSMGSDMKPCYSQNRDEFNRCLDTINKMKASIPESNIVKENYGTQIDTNQLLNQTYSQINNEKNRFSFSKVLFKISEVIQNIINWFRNIF